MEIVPQVSLEGKTCSKCGEFKPFSAFCQQRRRPGSYYSECKACSNARRRQQYQAADKDEINAYARQHYAEHKEQHREYVRRYRQNHPGSNSRHVERYRQQKRANGGNYTHEEWIALCEKYKYRCAACGGEGPLIADHVVPVSKGGPTTIENTQPLCESCNSRKRDKIIDYRS